eukprot:871749-Amphidinium_carterae.1
MSASGPWMCHTVAPLVGPRVISSFDSVCAQEHSAVALLQERQSVQIAEDEEQLACLIMLATCTHFCWPDPLCAWADAWSNGMDRCAC